MIERFTKNAGDPTMTSTDDPTMLLIGKMTQQKIDNWFDDTFRLTGRDVGRLMRQNNITIKELSKKMGITMKRIREVRNDDDVVLVGHAALDWIEHITGSLPARARAAYRQRARS